MDISLYDFQLDSVEKLRENIRQGVKNQILSAPTGSGKTIIATHLLREAYNKMSHAIFVADRINLIDQTSAVLDRYEVPHGVIQSNHWRWRPWERIQVASAATLERRNWPENTKLIIIDECHAIRKAVIKRTDRRDTVVLGLTATPFTKGLGKHYDAVVTVTTTNKLIEQGYLCNYRIFAASEPDMTGAKVVAGEWTDEVAAERSIPIVGDCVAEYLKHGDEKKFIAFCVNVAHCEEMQKQFEAAGVKCSLYTYRTPDEERTQMIKDLQGETELKGLITVSALSKGFDNHSIEVLIIARPLKSSLAEHIQILGRGLRSDPNNPAKVCTILDHAGNCIASGQRVLTQRGLVPIELILISDTLWDGHEFVSHKGVISRGKKRVIRYNGLTATADHPVKTDKGWRAFGDCAKEQAFIVTTGFGGEAIRECKNYFTSGGMAWKARASSYACPLRVRDVWLSVNYFVQQFKRWSNSWLQTMQRPQVTTEKSRCSPAMAFSTSEGNEAPLHESQGNWIRNVWRKGYSIQIQRPGGLRLVDCEEYRPSIGLQRHGIGSSEQRRPLRAGQHPLAIEPSQQKQHSQYEVGTTDACIQICSSRDSVRGYDVKNVSLDRIHLRSDRHEISPAIEEAEREVWDVLDAGPRNSFTCEGLLVHNCMRFWGEMQEFFEQGASELDDGKHKESKKKEPKERKPVKCPKCSAVHLASPVCPSCGFSYPKHSGITHEAGELAELSVGTSSRDEKQEVYSQLYFIANERGYKLGWVANQYRQRFGVWPKGLLDVEMPPSQKIMNWVRSRQIAWAKAKA